MGADPGRPAAHLASWQGEDLDVRAGARRASPRPARRAGRRRRGWRWRPLVVLAPLLAAPLAPTAARALPTVPGAPLNVTATADDEAAYVSWSAPSSDGGAAIDAYKVVAGATGATVLAPCAQCTTVYFSGLTNGASYSFAVYAHNAVGWSLLPGVSRSVTPQAPLEPAPGAPRDVRATASGMTATISWGTPASAGGAPIDRYLIVAYDDNLSMPGATYPYYAGSAYACGTCTSATFGGLTSGNQYHFYVFAHNRYSYSPGAASNGVAGSDPSCPPARICLTVDGTSDEGPDVWRADGFVHGTGFQIPVPTNAQGQAVFNYIGPSPSLIQALRPSQWRTDACTYPGGLGDPSQPICQWVRANTAATITDDLSTTYHGLTYGDYGGLSAALSSGAGALPPWECWSCYAQTVQSIVEHSATNADLPSYIGVSVTPDYWEIQNEPPDCCAGGYFGSNQDGTTALYLQQFKAAYEAIKAVAPTARLIAPSIADFTDTPIGCDAGDDNCAAGHGSNDPHILGLDSFLAYAVQNGLSFDAISWHDNSPLVEDTPNVAPDQTAELRWLLSQYGAPPAKAFVNEYGAQATNLIPGWSAGWIAALEAANVDEANRSCFVETDPEGNSYGECGGGSCRGSSATLPGTLDGLFTSPCLGPEALQPNGNYWVYRYYASMAGERLAVQTSDQTLTAFATKNDAAEEIQVLAGRHETCTPAQNPYDCSLASKQDIALLPTPVPAEVVLSVRYPYPASTVTVEVGHIPNSSGPVAQPVPTTLTLPVLAGVVTVPIASFADGDAYTLTIRPAG